jgi:N-acetylmuramoyl-L-alanine amidase
MDRARFGVTLGTALVALFPLSLMSGAGAQEPESVAVALPDSVQLTLPVDFDHGFPAIPAMSLEPMGWTGSGEPDEGEFGLVHRTGLELRFVPGSPFFAWDGELIHMASAPYWSEGQFYVPVQLAVDLFPGLLPDAYRYDEQRSLLLVEGASDVSGRRAELLSAPESTVEPEVSPVAPEGRPSPVETSLGPSPPPPWSPDREGVRDVVVIIDPGHGGDDPGAVGLTGLEEKEVALALALALARELSENPEIEVRLTRDRDTDVPLWTRGEWATEWKGNRRGVFISIHANALPDRTGVRGFETYFLSEARTEHERRVVAAENTALSDEADLGSAGEDPLLDSILTDLRILEYQQGSARLAGSVQRALSEFHPGPDRGVKQGPFAVITNALMPGILVEIGFITNPEEERLLSLDEFHRDAARAMARALEAFLQPDVSGGSG